MRIRFLLSLLGALAIGGCQVVSGLTGVDLDGASGGGTATGNACQKADKHIDQCSQSSNAVGAGSGGSSGSGMPPHFSSACTVKEKCDALCYEEASCTAIASGGALLGACLKKCR